jgi:non-homologous end joining protein Ku
MDEVGGLESSQKNYAKELSLGKTLVENLTSDKFDPAQYSDAYAKELEKLTISQTLLAMGSGTSPYQSRKQ